MPFCHLPNNVETLKVITFLGKKIAIDFALPALGSAADQAVNCRQLGFSSCQPTYLEWIAGQCDVCWVVVHIPPATENQSLCEVCSQIYPGHVLTCSGHSSSLYCLACLGHRKNSWLIDWLCVCGMWYWCWCHVQHETRNSSSGVGSSEYDLAAVIVHHGSGYVSLSVFSPNCWVIVSWLSYHSSSVWFKNAGRASSTSPGWPQWRMTYHFTNLVWMTRLSLHWTGHSGGYWEQTELLIDMMQAKQWWWCL